MASKEKIFDRLRSTRVPDVQLPSLDESWQTFPDRRQQFDTVLQAVGGQPVSARNMDDLNAQLKELEAYRQAKVIRSTVPGAGPPQALWQSIDDPHELEDTDFCIVAGQFAVAENGAVWIDGDALPHRAALFISQHLALVVPAAEIVNNMHEAYERLILDDSHFGIFVSGPSKTADIEQSLVIGAHGARSLTVFLLSDQG
jgi:L-lactate dehydrogenase complex protein LldG